MDAGIKTAIDFLVKRISGHNGNITADEALKFTQAALNLAHTAINIESMKTTKSVEIRSDSFPIR